MKEVQCISNVDNFLIVDKKLYFSNGKEVIGEKWTFYSDFSFIFAVLKL